MVFSSSAATGTAVRIGSAIHALKVTLNNFLNPFFILFPPFLLLFGKIILAYFLFSYNEHIYGKIVKFYEVYLIFGKNHEKIGKYYVLFIFIVKNQKNIV